MNWEELIETLWNVNQKRLLFMRQMPLELIETLWNVNAGSYKRLLSDKL